jgi:hypothetical protein
MPGLKARSTSGRALQGQGLFHLFPLPPLSPLSGACASPSPCHRPGLVEVVVFGFLPSHPELSCAARCPIGAPLRPALSFPRFFAPTHHPKSEVRSESMSSTYLPHAFPLHTFASTGTPSVIWGVTWEPRPSHALCMVCGLGPANPLGFGLSRVLLPSLRQVASVTLGLCLLLVSLDTFLISSLLLGCGRALEARGGEGGRPEVESRVPTGPRKTLVSNLLRLTS